MLFHRASDYVDNSVFIKNEICTVVSDLNDCLDKVNEMLRTFEQCCTVSVVAFEKQEEVTLGLDNRRIGKLFPVNAANLARYHHLFHSVERQ